jgi:hypothetical protein
MFAWVSGPTTKVKFQLHRECHFGEQYNVVGGDPQFGDWDPDAAIPLAWSKDHVWTVEMVSLSNPLLPFSSFLYLCQCSFPG